MQEMLLNNFRPIHSVGVIFRDWVLMLWSLWRCCTKFGTCPSKIRTYPSWSKSLVTLTKAVNSCATKMYRKTALGNNTFHTVFMEGLT